MHSFSHVFKSAQKDGTQEERELSELFTEMKKSPKLFKIKDYKRAGKRLVFEKVPTI